ncbi:MAG: hypothetical protein RLZZ490_1810 [Cyanobacteriota bacterium]
MGRGGFDGLNHPWELGEGSNNALRSDIKKRTGNYI